MSGEKEEEFPVAPAETDEGEAFNSFALQGLLGGDLKPLAALLKREDLPIQNSVRRVLVQLIEGQAEEHGLRLKSEKHPDLSRRAQSRWEQVKRAARVYNIALFIEENGGREAGQHEAAITAAMALFKLKRARVEAIWAEREKALALLESESDGG